MTVKRIAMVVTALCALALLTAPTWSQEGKRQGKGGKGDKGGQAQQGPMVALMKADTNQDGKLSLDEYKAFSEKMFKEADTNKDGFVDKAEMKGLLPARPEAKGDEAKAPRKPKNQEDEDFGDDDDF